MKRVWIVVALMAALGAGLQTVAQTASELLQKGIYTQETLGDLDSAIKIYKQLLSAANENRLYAAQAQYRLAICLLAKGDAAEATKAFQRVIEDYPEQKELGDKAREHMPGALKLLPAPWAESEVMELRMKSAGGITAGVMGYSIEPAPGDPARRWLIRTRTHTMMFQYGNRVTVDRATFQPVASEYLNPAAQSLVEYQPRQARIRMKGKDSVSTVDLDGPTYDNEQCMYLLRRLPLAPGFKATVSLLSPAGGIVKASIETTALEEVEVPAGKFRAYRVQISPANQTVWISADGPRYLVKWEGSGIVVELTAVRAGQPTAPATYRDEQLGFSLSAPGDWSFQKIAFSTEKPGNPFAVLLLDPQMAAACTLWVVPKKKEAGQPDLKSEAEKWAEGQTNMRKGYKIRAESWQSRQVGGRPALSYVADCADLFDASRKMVDYVTLVRSEGLAVQFTVQLEAGELEGFRKRFDPILESLQLR